MCATEPGPTIHCTVNGEARAFAPGATLAELLGADGSRRRPVAIECNGLIVPRSRHQLTTICAGDVIEIVGAVGGG